MPLRPGLSPAVWTLLAVLVVAIAGVTHAVTVLALPWRSSADAFARVAAVMPPEGRATLGSDGPASLPFTDPALLTEACRFDLGQKPFRLALSPFADSFVTIGFHSRHGIAFYGLTVRATDATSFDLVLDQKAADHAEAPAEPDAHRVTVVAPEADGFVTLATPLGDGSAREAAEERLGKVDCRSDTAPPPS